MNPVLPLNTCPGLCASEVLQKCRRHQQGWSLMGQDQSQERGRGGTVQGSLLVSASIDGPNVVRSGAVSHYYQWSQELSQLRGGDRTSFGLAVSLPAPGQFGV